MKTVYITELTVVSCWLAYKLVNFTRLGLAICELLNKVVEAKFWEFMQIQSPYDFLGLKTVKWMSESIVKKQNEV